MCVGERALAILKECVRAGEREREKECVSKGSRRALPKLRKTTTTTRRRVKTAFGESV